ncbi:MAG: MBL fold metallo-hydrolase, partial [Chloroflexi bacterium]|nr:MBL fold metallo-hydrolase [Chloroflexota bacterium]
APDPVGGGRALLIDSGLDADYGKAARKACEAMRLKPVAVINTHAHADHFGGNDYLARNCGVRVYAPAFEEAIMRYPELEPTYLFNGAYPIHELQNKWLMAKASPVHQVVEAGELAVEGLSAQIKPLPGHSRAQVGVLVNGVLFCGDAVIGEGTLEKYKIPFGADIARQIESIHALQAMKVERVVCAHGEPVSDVTAMAEANLAAIERASRAVREAIQTPGDASQVVARVGRILGLQHANVSQFYLFQSVITAYLAYLQQLGQARLELREQAALWSAV